MDELNEMNEEKDRGSFTGKGLNKALAVMFVFAIYLVIFLKILFLK